jgi:DNA-binding response OmpR family regulator
MALDAAAEEPARPRVLVVDDEVCLARLMADSLGRSGCETRVCHDGKGALETALGWPAEVVLLDARMPGMDGYEVCRRLRASGYGAPILIWSGHDSVSDVVLAYDAGADDHVSKTADVTVLKAKIRRALERASRPPGGALGDQGIHPPPRVSGIRDLLTGSGVDAPAIDRAGLTRLEEHIFSKLRCARGATVWTDSLFRERWDRGVEPRSCYRPRHHCARQHARCACGLHVPGTGCRVACRVRRIPLGHDRRAGVALGPPRIGAGGRTTPSRRCGACVSRRGCEEPADNALELAKQASWPGMVG